MKKTRGKNYVIAKHVNGLREKIGISELSFRPAIYGIIIKKDKVLLMPSWDGYDFPGGGVKLGETLDEALKREVWEETGLKVKRGDTVTVESAFFISMPEEKRFHSILIYCLCKNVQGKVTDQNFETLEKIYLKKAVWVPLEEISRLKFYNPLDNTKIVKRALEVQRKNMG